MPVRIVPRAEQESELGSRFYRGGMVVEASGGLHPGKYVRGLAQAAARAGATLIGGTRVTGFRREGGGWRIATNRGEMRADAVLMATNGYTAGGPMPYLSRRLLPVASYIIATEQMDPATIRTLFPTMRMISDSRRVLSYFRPSPDGTRILWGGRASFSDITAAQAAPVLARMMANVFPRMRGVRLTHAWRGNVAFTFDFLPHLGVQNGIHYAAGCQGSGVAMMSWMGHQAALAMAGRGNARFSFAEMTMPTMPGYGGRPWFLPMVGGWYRLRDWWDRRRDG
jgi:glycine/D-amino acid oxidase-like deaminating enzyme